MNPLELIIAHYNKGGKEDVYHQAIGQILKNLKKIEDATIYDVAEWCFVSTTTISRLSKKLGYKNFIAFKTALARIVKRYAYFNRYVSNNAINRGMEEYQAYFHIMHKQLDDFQKEVDYDFIDQIVEEIHRFRKINFYSYGFCGFEQFFQTDLIISGRESIIIPDPIDQIEDAKTLDHECMIIIHLPDTSEGVLMEEVMKTAKMHGAKILLMTNSHNASFSQYADYCYSFEGMRTILDGYRVEMFINLLSITYRQKFIK